MKNKLPALFFAFGIALISLSLNAQENTENSQRINYKHGLGMAAGATTGWGLSYRYCPSRFSVQATFSPYKNEYSTSVSAGIAFLYNLVETKSTSFFLYEGNHFRYNHTAPDPNNSFITEGNNSQWNNGIGIGIEFLMFKRVSFNLMAGYASYDMFRMINVTGETGLYYKF